MCSPLKGGLVFAGFNWGRCRQLCRAFLRQPLLVRHRTALWFCRSAISEAILQQSSDPIAPPEFARSSGLVDSLSTKHLRVRGERVSTGRAVCMAEIFPYAVLKRLILKL